MKLKHEVQLFFFAYIFDASVICSKQKKKKKIQKIAEHFRIIFCNLENIGDILLSW